MSSSPGDDHTPTGSPSVIHQQPHHHVTPSSASSSVTSVASPSVDTPPSQARPGGNGPTNLRLQIFSEMIERERSDGTSGMGGGGDRIIDAATTERPDGRDSPRRDSPRAAYVHPVRIHPVRKRPPLAARSAPPPRQPEIAQIVVDTPVEPVENKPWQPAAQFSSVAPIVQEQQVEMQHLQELQQREQQQRIDQEHLSHQQQELQRYDHDQQHDGQQHQHQEYEQQVDQQSQDHFEPQLSPHDPSNSQQFDDDPSILHSPHGDSYLPSSDLDEQQPLHPRDENKDGPNSSMSPAAWSFPPQPQIPGVFLETFQPQPQQQHAYAAHLQQLYAMQQQQQQGHSLHYSYMPHQHHQLAPPSLGGGYHYAPVGMNAVGGGGYGGGYDGTLDYVYEEDDEPDYREDEVEFDGAYEHTLDPAIYQEETTPFLERLKRACIPSIENQKRLWLLLWSTYEWTLFLGVLFIIFANSIKQIIHATDRDNHHADHENFQKIFDDFYIFFFVFFTLEFFILLKYHPLYRKEYHLIALDFLAIFSILPFISIIWNPLMDDLPGRSFHSVQPTFHDYDDEHEGQLTNDDQMAPRNYHSQWSSPGEISNNEYHPHTFASLSLILLMRTAFLVRIIRFLKQKILVRAMAFIRFKRKEYAARQRKKAWITRAKERQARDKLRRKQAREARELARDQARIDAGLPPRVRTRKRHRGSHPGQHEEDEHEFDPQADPTLAREKNGGSTGTSSLNGDPLFQDPEEISTVSSSQEENSVRSRNEEDSVSVTQVIPDVGGPPLTPPFQSLQPTGRISATGSLTRDRRSPINLNSGGNALGATIEMAHLPGSMSDEAVTATKQQQSSQQAQLLSSTDSAPPSAVSTPLQDMANAHLSSQQPEMSEQKLDYPSIYKRHSPPFPNRATGRKLTADDVPGISLDGHDHSTSSDIDDNAPKSVSSTTTGGGVHRGTNSISSSNKRPANLTAHSSHRSASSASMHTLKPPGDEQPEDPTSMSPEELDEKVTPYALSHLSSMQTTDLATDDMAPFAVPRNLSHELYDSDTPQRLRHSNSLPNGTSLALDGSNISVDRQKQVGFLLGENDDEESASDESSEYDEGDWDDQYARSHMRDPGELGGGGNKHGGLGGGGPSTVQVQPQQPPIEQTIIGSFTSHQLSDFTTTLLIFIILLLVYLYHVLHDLPFDDVGRVGLERIAEQWNAMEMQLWDLNQAMGGNENKEVVQGLYQTFLATFLAFNSRSTYYLASLPIVHFSLQHSSGLNIQNMKYLNWKGLFGNSTTSGEYSQYNLIGEPEPSNSTLRFQMRHSPFFISLQPRIHTFEQLLEFEAQQEENSLGLPITADEAQHSSPGYWLFQVDDSSRNKLQDEEITRWSSLIFTQDQPYGNGTMLDSVPIGLVFIQVKEDAYELFLFHLLYILFFLAFTSFLLFRYDLYIQKILKPIERMMLFIEKMMADPLGEITLNDPRDDRDGRDRDGDLYGDGLDDTSDDDTNTNTSLADENESKNWSREADLHEQAEAEKQILREANEAILRNRKSVLNMQTDAATTSKDTAARHSSSHNNEEKKQNSMQKHSPEHSSGAGVIPLRRRRASRSTSSQGRRPSLSESSNTDRRPSVNSKSQQNQGRRASKSRSTGGGGGGHARKGSGSQKRPASSKETSPHPSPLLSGAKEPEKDSSKPTGLKLLDTPASTAVTAVTAPPAKPLIGAGTARQRRFSNETSTVEKSLKKLVLLLQVGFGVAGSSIISNNLVAGDLLNPIQKGRKIFAIFGFCDLKPVVQSYFDSGEEDECDTPEPSFSSKKKVDDIIVSVKDSNTDSGESFIEQIMIFINQLQAIVHGETHKYGGFINSSIGSNTLMAWKFDVEGFERMEQQYGGNIPLPATPLQQPLQPQSMLNPHMQNSGLMDFALGQPVTARTGTSAGPSTANSTAGTPMFSAATALARRHSLSIVTASGPAPFPTLNAPVVSPHISASPPPPLLSPGVGPTVPSTMTHMNRSLPMKQRSLSISSHLNLGGPTGPSPMLAPSTPNRPFPRRGSLSRLDGAGASTPTASGAGGAGGGMSAMVMSSMSSIPLSMSMRSMSLGVAPVPSSTPNGELRSRRNSLSAVNLALPDRAPSPRMRSMSPAASRTLTSLPASPLKRSSTMGNVAGGPPGQTGALSPSRSPRPTGNPRSPTTSANPNKVSFAFPPGASPSLGAPGTPSSGPSGSPKLLPLRPGGGTPDPAVSSGAVQARELFRPGSTSPTAHAPPLLARSQTSFAYHSSVGQAVEHGSFGVASPPRRPTGSPRLLGIPQNQTSAGQPPLNNWPVMPGGNLPAPALQIPLPGSSNGSLGVPNKPHGSSAASTPGSANLSKSNSSTNLHALGKTGTPSPATGSTVIVAGQPVRSSAPSLYDTDETPAKPKDRSSDATKLKPPVPPLHASPRAGGGHARHRSFTFEVPGGVGSGTDGHTPSENSKVHQPPSPALNGNANLRPARHVRTTSTNSQALVDMSNLEDYSGPTTPHLREPVQHRAQQRRASLPTLSFHPTPAVAPTISSGSSSHTQSTRMRGNGAESLAAMSGSSSGLLQPLPDGVHQDGIMSMDRLDLLRQASLTSNSSNVLIASQSRPPDSGAQSFDTSRQSTNAPSPHYTPGQGSPIAHAARSRTLVFRPRTNSIPDVLLRGGPTWNTATAAAGRSTHGHAHSLNPAMANLFAAAANDTHVPDAPAPSPAFLPSKQEKDAQGNSLAQQSIPEVEQHPNAAQDDLDVNGSSNGTVLSNLRRHSSSQSKLVAAAMLIGVGAGTRHGRQDSTASSSDSIPEYEHLISVHGGSMDQESLRTCSIDQANVTSAMDPSTLDAELASKSDSLSNSRGSPDQLQTLTIQVPPPSSSAEPSASQTSSVSWSAMHTSLNGDASIGQDQPANAQILNYDRLMDPGSLPVIITPPRTIRQRSLVQLETHHTGVRTDLQLSPITPPLYESNGTPSDSQQRSPTTGGTLSSPTSRMDKKRPPALFDTSSVSQSQLDLLAAAASSHPPLLHTNSTSSGSTSQTVAHIDFGRLIPMTLSRDTDLSSPSSPKRVNSTSALTDQTPQMGSTIQVSLYNESSSEPRRFSSSNSLAYPPPAASAVYGPNPYGPSFPSTAIPSPAFRPQVFPSTVSPMLRYASPTSFYPHHQQGEDLSPDSANIDSLTEDPNSPHNDVTRAFLRMGMHPYGQMELRRTASQALLAFCKTLVKVATDNSLDRWRKHALLKPHLTGIGGMQLVGSNDADLSVSSMCNRGAGMGLHIGWAIEGAIGSKHKIDATYLSPNVNLASRLAAATKQYFVALLFSHNFLKLLPQILRDRCRLVDHVVLKGSAKPMRIYTFDIFVDLAHGAPHGGPFGGLAPSTSVPSATPSPPPGSEMNILSSHTPTTDASGQPLPRSGGATPQQSHTRASSRGGAGWAAGDLAELSRLSAGISDASRTAQFLTLPMGGGSPLPPLVPHFSLEANVHASLEQDMAKLNLTRRTSLTGHTPRDHTAGMPSHMRRRTSISQAQAQAAAQQQQVEMALLATQQQQQQQARALHLHHHLQYIQQQQQAQMQSSQQELQAVFDVPNSDPSIECLSPSPIPAPAFDQRRRPSAPATFTFNPAPAGTPPPPNMPDMRLHMLPPPPPSSLTTDPILQKLLFVLFSLQHHLPNPLFILTHNHATNAYIHGDWYLARQLYEQILQWHKTDGPARVLLEYMARYNYQAPHDWPGYRKLEKK